nr:unnamed protein product [Callosobruchus chinensis]
MGGIDLIDRMISYYRMGARSKKWTVKTIFHPFDLAMANSWIFYRDDRHKLGDTDIMKFLEFKIGISEYPNTKYTRSTSSPRPFTQSLTARNKIDQHFPARASELKNSVRCKNQRCKQKTKIFCESCNVFLSHGKQKLF